MKLNIIDCLSIQNYYKMVAKQYLNSIIIIPIKFVIFSVKQ